MLRKFVFLAFVSLTAFADDFFVGDPAIVPAQPWHSANPVVLASDGDTFYVFRHNGMNRVRPDGTIVDAEAFRVPDMTEPFSAAYGRGIVVVTYADRSDPYWVTQGHAAAFTTDGRLLWANYVATERSHVVYDGRDFVVLFEYSGDVFAHVLDDQGNVTRRMTLVDDDDLYVRSTPVAVRTDEGLLAVFRDGQGSVYTLLFDASGASGEPLLIGGGKRSSFGGYTRTFDVASNGSGAVLVWTNSVGNGLAPLVARQVDARGAPVSHTFDIPFYLSANWPAVMWDGERYQLAWMTNYSNLLVATIDAGATSISSLETVASGFGLFSPALAVAKQRVLLGWVNFGEGGARGKLANTGEPFARSPEQFLKTQPNDAFAPAAVWAGSHYVMAWFRSQRTVTGNFVVVRRFDARGVALDSAPIAISNEVNQFVPVIRIASNGRETAVVWTDDTRLFVSRIAAGGTRIDAEPLVVATGVRPDSADIASDGNGFAIGWSDGDTVHVRRLSARGGFGDESLIEHDSEISVVRLAWGGHDYVVGFNAGTDGYGTMLADADPVLMMERTGTLAVASSGSLHLFAGSKIVLTDSSLRVRSVTDAPHSFEAVVWTGTSFFGSGAYASTWISTSGHVASTRLPSAVYHLFPETAVASPGDGTAVLVFSAATRTERMSLYGRVVAPKRRSAE